MAPSEVDEAARCGHCDALGAPAVCAGCRSIRYCGPDCQRLDWRAGHRSTCRSIGRRAAPQVPQAAADASACPPQPSAPSSSSSAAAFPGPAPPLRCPEELLQGRRVPRLDRLDSTEAQDMLCEGNAFVAPMEGLLGRRLLKWDFKYLQNHLPAEQQYGVMLDEGSGKIVMSHSARNGDRQVDLSKAASEGGGGQPGGEACPFGTSDQTRMTFGEFQEEAERFRRSGGKGKLPYFGCHLLWRFKPTDNGYLGHIDKEMEDDLWSIRFDLIKEWQEVNLLPLVQRFYLFAGLGGTLYHCHYDLQPNLHVQLTGRKRFILFPPEDWASLYPFPVHHDLDRRSMVDLDAPDGVRFPKWNRARGMMVDLEPGDALYIPPYWWHHVQSLSAETTSMAMWFFERFPLSEGVQYGVGPRARELAMLRDVEELVGKHFPDAPGEEENTKARPVKASQVAAFFRWLRPRLAGEAGAGAGGRAAPSPCAADGELLGSLTVSREDVEALALQLIGSRLEAGGGAEADVVRAGGAPAEALLRDTLRSFLEDRF
mmetsp:Transcript_107461/g.342543  ORF Transcript_107461/g.342543 Transcript_107461/m.342543 type:complete len:541 (-) Transcript_107461:81-1703(-)